MNKSDVGDLLTVIVAFDRRTTGDADIEAWYLIISDLELADCAQAVKDHYTERRDWLMPADVHSRATTIANRRLGQLRIAENDAYDEAETRAIESGLEPTDVAETKAELAARLKAMATRSHTVPHVDPRPPRVRRREAEAELDALRSPVNPIRDERPVEVSDPSDLATEVDL